MLNKLNRMSLLCGVGLSVALSPAASALPIIPASDGTGTLVTPQGNSFVITGGTIAGTNQFHSFQSFGLGAGQSTNFITNVSIHNILARVNGGSPSIVNGLLQVSGSNANLYLLNPAGIVFGSGASLNVPASFTATTANAIGFANNSWFTALGNNNYSSLTGNPTVFLFNANNGGSVVNLGNLTTPGNLSLIGSQALSTGSISGSTITVMAVPGTNLVRISQPGHILSLEVVPPQDNLITPLSLPALLTGQGINPNPDGTVTLNNIPIPFSSGTAVVSGNINSPGGRVQILGDRLALLGANINTSSPLGGGTVLVGGEYLGRGPYPNAQFTFADSTTRIRANGLGSADGGRVIVWADNTTRFFGQIAARGGNLGGNGGFIETSGKFNLDVTGIRISAQAPLGNPGIWLLDPTQVDIVPPGVTAGGSFFGGIFTPDGVSSVATIPNTVIEALLTGGTAVTIRTEPGPAGGTGDINVIAPINLTFGSATSLRLEAARDINISAAIATSSGNPLGVELLAPNGNINITGNIITQGGAFRAVAGGGVNQPSGFSINTSTNVAPNPGGSITIDATSGLAVGALDSGHTSTNSGGSIFLNSSQGSIQTQTINTTSNNANSGGVNVSAPRGSIQTQHIQTLSSGGAGGPVTLSAGGSVRVIGVTPICFSISICTNGNPVTSSGAVNINHGGGVTDLFTIGVPSVPNPSNGTSGGIRTGAITTNNVTVSVPPEVNSFGDFVTIRTQAPPPPTISNNLGILLLLANPNPPTAPEPIVVGEPPAPEPAPSPVPLPSPVPPLVPVPLPSPVPSPSPPPPLVIEPPRQLTAQQEQTASRELIAPPVQRVDAIRENGFFQSLEASMSGDFAEFFNLSGSNLISLEEVREVLEEVRLSTGTRTAIAYVFFSRGEIQEITQNSQARSAVERSSLFPRPDDVLEIAVLTERGRPIRQRTNVTRRQFMEVAQQFRGGVLNYRSSPREFLVPAQQLHRWLITPISPQLETDQINNLSFILDEGLRSLPLAALHDGQSFIIEKYSIGLIPSLSLTDLRYRDIRNAQLLAMGADSFADNLPLPGVGVELRQISQLWGGQFFLNQDFTLDKLRQQHQQQGTRIIHLATHGFFAGADESYIQFWNSRLRLNQLGQLGFSDPKVDLLVLSACQTALGDRDAELGFAGLAIQAGVATTFASLWEVSDEATLAMMVEFYDQLRRTPIKAEAVRQAQLAMLRRQVALRGGRLVIGDRSFEVTPEVAKLGNRVFSHPFFWSAFTLVGSPW